MLILKQFVGRLDGWLATLEALVLGLLVAAMTGVTLAQVVARYAFNEPLIWSEEAARYLFVWVSLVGAALATREGAHYALDALLERLSPVLRTVARGVAVVIGAGFLLILLRTGLDETAQAALQDSATLPIGMALPYAAIPVGAALMLFHLLAGLLRERPVADTPLPEGVG
ncbi:TRAP transporter small permease [Roseomonas sp. KE2513]|uniref:TRAP transporter small permease n=1 Tax=Roseomonas sp. KE2513 TaxID=2479202 RepID=UPI0018DF1013|nr:TRAP transporter small permease [Roseomonas sp. KE2513]MBI0537952.1 TRAP transporter small permease [Roseomonas sp. KE2513]